MREAARIGCRGGDSEPTNAGRADRRVRASRAPCLRALTRAFGLLAALWLLGACIPALAQAAAEPEGIHKIQHVVMIMQENRSFDSYFGTYPGANGIPANTCLPDPANGGCVKPFHDPNDRGPGGPHGTEGGRRPTSTAGAWTASSRSVRSRKMHIDQADLQGCTTEQKEAKEALQRRHGLPRRARDTQLLGIRQGVHAAGQHVRVGAASWSLPEHLFMVSGWSAKCPRGDENPMDCVNTLDPETTPSTHWDGPIIPGKATYAWTDLTYLMAKAHVSWRYYVKEGQEPDCENDEAITCKPPHRATKTPGIWNPLADFTDVKQDGQLGNIQSLDNFYTACTKRSLVRPAERLLGDPQPGSLRTPAVARSPSPRRT